MLTSFISGCVIGATTMFLVIYAGHRWHEHKKYWEEIENDKIRKGIR